MIQNVVSHQFRWQRSVHDLLRSEARSGLPGLLVSVAAHGVLLLILALIVIHFDVNDEGSLDFGWSDPDAQNTPTERVAPVRVQSLQVRPVAIQPKPQPKPSNTGEQVIARSVQPVDVSSSLAARKVRTKGAIEGQGDGKEVRRAISLGLEWLQRQQKSSGNWQLHDGYPDAGYSALRTDTGATALALLAFLGDGHTHHDGEFQDTVGRGLKWLVGIQKPDGDYHDHTELGRQSAFYAHSMATIVVCEAYALTGDETLHKSADQAVQFLLDTQQPKQGGWRYQPQDADTMGDLSVTGWVLMALHSARMAGIEVPLEAYSLTSLFLDATAVNDGAMYRYLPSDSPDSISASMTASGLLARQWMGWPKDDIVMQRGVEWLLSEKHKPVWNAGDRNIYAWYYTAQVLHNIGGATWKDWYNDVQSQVVDNQRRRGSRKPGEDVFGSWSPSEPPGAGEEYGTKGGRLYFTVLCLLILETPTRHAPLYDPS